MPGSTNGIEQLLEHQVVLEVELTEQARQPRESEERDLLVRLVRNKSV